jgi:hypothetical protein
MKVGADFNLLNRDDLMSEAPELYLESEGVYEKMAGKWRTETKSTTKPPLKKHRL